MKMRKRPTDSMTISNNSLVNVKRDKRSKKHPYKSSYNMNTTLYNKNR